MSGDRADPWKRAALLLAALAALASAGCGDSGKPVETPPAPAGRFVIGPDMQPVLMAAFRPVGPLADQGWRLHALSIDQDQVVAVYAGREGQVSQVTAVHPSAAPPEALLAGPFALTVRTTEGSADLLSPLKRQLAGGVPGFAWIPLSDGPSVPADPQNGRPVGEVTGDPSPADRELDRLLAGAWSGELPDWETRLDRLLTDARFKPDRLLRLARELFDLGWADRSRDIYRRLLADLEPPAGAQPRADVGPIRAAALLALGRTEEGLEALERASDGPPGAEAALCQRLADAFQQRVDPAEPGPLLAGLERLRARRTDCRPLDLALAVELDRAGRSEEAVGLLERIAGQPAAGRSERELLARLYQKTGRDREAVAVWRRLCPPGDCNAVTRGNLLWAQSGIGQDPAVVEEYVARAAATPDDRLLQFEAGVMLHYVRRYGESQPLLEKAREAWPDDPRLLLYSAMNSYRSGRQAEAESAIEHALGAASHPDPDLFYCRGVIFRNSDIDRSIESIERYLRLTRRGSVPEKKRALVERFLTALHEERARRAGGAAARPFSDPEQPHFGEPPGSPGAAADAIAVFDRVEQPPPPATDGPTGRREQPSPEGGQPQAGQPEGGPDWQIDYELLLIVAFAGLSLLFFLLGRRKTGQE